MNHMLRYISIILIKLFLIQTAFSQIEDSSSISKKLLVLPIVYYSPETELGFGIIGNITYKQNDIPAQKTSKANLILSYTLKNQFIFLLDFESFSKENKWKYIGEIGYYIFSSKYYGIGNTQSKSLEEIYEVDFLRAELKVLKKLNNYNYFGIGFKHDYYFEVRPLDDAVLSREDLGSEGGTVTQWAVSYERDKRDHLFFPSKGNYFLADFDISIDNVLSDYSFSTLSLEYRSFHKLNERNIFAWNAGTKFQSNKPPFYWMSKLGSGHELRGYLHGRYRDLNYIYIQGELRHKLANKWHVVTALALGDVFRKTTDLAIDRVKYSGVIGLRYLINPEEKMNIRLDIGITPEGFTGYLNFGEAF